MNALGRELLGEHEPHTDPIKPRSARLEAPTRDRPGLLHLRWLSDDVDPVNEPDAAVGTVVRCGGSFYRVAEVGEGRPVAAVDLLEQAADDPDLEVDLRALSPALFPDEPRTEPNTLDAPRLARSLCDRWNHLARWRPVQRLDRAEHEVPAAVRDELVTNLAISRVAVRAVGVAQVKFTPEQGAVDKPVSVVDLRLRWHPCSESAAIWATALTRLTAWDGLGLQTQAGLGQVQVTSALRASDLD